MKKGLLTSLAVLLLVLGIPVSAWVLESSRPESGRTARSTAQGVLSPVARFLEWTASGMSGALEYVVTTGKVREENAANREKIAQVRAENAVLREAIAKYQRLAPPLALAEINAWKVIEADVVAREGRPWTRSVVINRGAGAGVEVGDPVLHRDGLAGLVVRVTPWTATVQMLSDPRTAIGAVTLPTRAPGIVTGKGESGVLELTPRDPKSPPHPGQRVITSGTWNSLYPRGLEIGEVGALKRNQFGQTVGEVRPFVRFEDVEEVLVLKTGTKARPGAAETPAGESTAPAPESEDRPTSSGATVAPLAKAAAPTPEDTPTTASKAARR
jgi:rod shape-determining protein MreC